MTSLPPEMDDPPASGPAPFVLTIDTPVGLPWDQWRQARLEAENSAPLAVDQLRYDLRRIGRWMPGQPGRFAAAYFHRSQVTGELSHAQDFDGGSLKFTIRDDAAENRARLRQWGPIAAGALGCAAIVGSVLLALTDRAEADAALEGQRIEAQRALTAQENAERRRAESRALEAVGARGSRLSDALDDIGWLSRARDPASSVRAIDWAPSGMTVTAVGPSSPIVAKDRAVQSASVPGATSLWIVPAPPDRQGKGATVNP